MSNLNQLSKLPDNWKVLPFLEAVKDVTGGNSKIKQADAKTIGVYPVVDQGQQENCGFIDNKDDLCREELPAILFGDHTKILKFIDYPFALGADGVKVLSPKAPIDKKFLFYFLKTLKLPENAGYSRHYKFLKDAVVPLPPLPEQKRIAAILDKADNLRRKNQQAIQLADQFLRAVFLDLFGDPVTNPKGWDVKQINEVCSHIVDCVNRTAKTVDFVTPYKMIRTTNVRNYKIDINDVRYVNKDTYETWTRRLKPKAGDIVFTREAPSGEAGIIETDEPVFLGQRTMQYRPIENIVHPVFLLFELMDSGIKSQIKQLSTGSTVTHLSVPECKKFNIRVPPIELQNKFGNIRNRILGTSKKKVLSQLCSENLFCSLSQKAFAGEL